jgi:hypothetical protein
MKTFNFFEIENDLDPPDPVWRVLDANLNPME